MTLDEFAAMYRADLEAFVDATKRMQADGAADFNGKFLSRTYDDWLNEMAAYGQYMDLQEGGV